jgi:Superinfection immunity protein
MVTFFFLAGFAAVYFIPGIIASCRHHQNTRAIWVLNILGGWTMVGWLAVFVSSLM